MAEILFIAVSLSIYLRRDMNIQIREESGAKVEGNQRRNT